MRAALDRASVPAVAVVAALWSLPIFDRGMFLMDEGHILMFADIVANGGELYRDATLLPLPGAFYLLAAAFDVFGPSVIVARWIVLAEFVVLCVCVFVVVRRVAGLGAGWGAVGLVLLYRIWAYPHWQLYSYSTLALCLLAVALAAFTRFLESGDRRTLGLAGLATGLAIFTKQDYGGAGLVAMVAVLLLHVRATRARALPLLASYVGAAALVGLATAFHFLRQGLFGEMLRQTLWNHLFGIATFEYTGLPPLLPLFAQDPALRTPAGIATYAPSILFQVDWARLTASALYRETFLFDLATKLFFYAPYVVVALGGVRLWRRRARLGEPGDRLAYLQEAALYAVAAMLVLILNRPVDYLHVAVLYWPLLCLLAVYTRSLVAGPRGTALAVGALVAVVALPAAAYTAQLGLRLRRQASEPLRTERAGVYVDPQEERVIGELVDYVARNSDPGDEVAVLPYFTLVSFLAERRAPHRAIYTFWPIEYIPDRQRQIIDAMAASGSDIAVYHFTQALVFPRMDEFAPELFAWMVDHYEIERVFSHESWGYMAAGLRRREGDGPGRPLFADAAALSLEIESPDGARQPFPERSRARAADTALWPFRPVVALTPRADGERTVASIELDVPPDARLRTAVGANPTHWFQYPPSATTFEVRAVVDGRRELLARRVLDPHRDHRDRGWLELDLPLDAWAGRRLTLELAAGAERDEGAVPEMGGFALPRIVTPASGR